MLDSSYNPSLPSLSPRFTLISLVRLDLALPHSKQLARAQAQMLWRSSFGEVQTVGAFYYLSLLFHQARG